MTYASSQGQRARSRGVVPDTAAAVLNGYILRREERLKQTSPSGMCRARLFHFMHEFWDVVSASDPHWNWHIEYLCQQLEAVVRRVAAGLPKHHDLIINIPPGTTKSLTCSVMLPAWCWTNWPWMRFIVGSYSSALSLEHAEYTRDIVRSDKFQQYFPELSIKQDKDTKSNFRVIETKADGTQAIGGNRYSTSVGGTLTGFHGHVLIVDDPLNPKESASKVKVETANKWMEQTLSTRKIDKAVTATILIMQRLHEDDPTGHILAKKKDNVFHISLPGEIRSYGKYVRPVELLLNYRDDLLDPVRMPWTVLKEMEVDLGQYGYAGQVGQHPTPPGGGMFKVDFFQVIEHAPMDVSITKTIRYWDKACTPEELSQGGARTAGVKMSQLRNGKFLIHDCKVGRWSTDDREKIIKETAAADGENVPVYIEQEPGSGGKESAQATIRNLAGHSTFADLPRGDKTFRADPYSVQVNNGNVWLMHGDWNYAFTEEHRFFPFGTTKDMVDAAAGAFNKLVAKKLVSRVV